MELEKIRELTAGFTMRDLSEIHEHTRFLKDLGMDSLDVLQLIVEIETYFGVEFGDEAQREIKTVGNAAEMVRKLA